MPSRLNDVVARLGNEDPRHGVDNLKPVRVSIELVSSETLREPGRGIARPDFVARWRPDNAHFGRRPNRRWRVWRNFADASSGPFAKSNLDRTIDEVRSVEPERDRLAAGYLVRGREGGRRGACERAEEERKSS